MTSHLLQHRGRTFTFVCYSTVGGFALVIFLACMAARSDKAAEVAGPLMTSFAGMVSAATLALGARSTMDAHKQGPTSEGV